jgi:hypothetical protein
MQQRQFFIRCFDISAHVEHLPAESCRDAVKKARQLWQFCIHGIHVGPQHLEPFITGPLAFIDIRSKLNLFLIERLGQIMQAFPEFRVSQINLPAFLFIDSLTGPVQKRLSGYKRIVITTPFLCRLHDDWKWHLQFADHKMGRGNQPR